MDDLRLSIKMKSLPRPWYFRKAVIQTCEKPGWHLEEVVRDRRRGDEDEKVPVTVTGVAKANIVVELFL